MSLLVTLLYCPSPTIDSAVQQSKRKDTQKLLFGHTDINRGLFSYFYSFLFKPGPDWPILPSCFEFGSIQTSTTTRPDMSRSAKGNRCGAKHNLLHKLHNFLLVEWAKINNLLQASLKTF